MSADRDKLLIRVRFITGNVKQMVEEYERYGMITVEKISSRAWMDRISEIRSELSGNDQSSLDGYG